MGMWFHPVSSRRNGSEAEMFGAGQIYDEFLEKALLWFTPCLILLGSEQFTNEITDLRRDFLVWVKSWSVYANMVKGCHLKFQATGNN